MILVFETSTSSDQEIFFRSASVANSSKQTPRKFHFLPSAYCFVLLGEAAAGFGDSGARSERASTGRETCQKWPQMVPGAKPHLI